MSAGAVATPFDDLTTQQTPSNDIATPFDDLVKPSASVSGPSPEEQQFLQANPGHKYIPADPAFPNRPAGVYPTGKGNEWRNDPSYSQSPVDLQFAKHTAQGAGEAALATGSAAVSPFVGSAFSAVAAHLDKVKSIIDYAEKIGLKGLEYKGAKDLYKEFFESKGK